jgi:hypothetical protein
VPTPVIPAGWKTYESLDASFTFSYPKDWVKQSESSRGVQIKGGGLVLFFDLIKDTGNEWAGSDKENISLVATTAADSFKDDLESVDFNVLEKGVWETSTRKGWYVIATWNYKNLLSEDKTPTVMCQIYFQAGDDALSVGLAKIMSAELERSDLDTLRTICDTIVLSAQ